MYIYVVYRCILYIRIHICMCNYLCIPIISLSLSIYIYVSVTMHWCIYIVSRCLCVSAFTSTRRVPVHVCMYIGWHSLPLIVVQASLLTLCPISFRLARRCLYTGSASSCCCSTVWLLAIQYNAWHCPEVSLPTSAVSKWCLCNISDSFHMPKDA